MAPWFAIWDAVVLASASEGTPATLIEALAAGRPVVSTDVGGVSDVVDEGETGFLVRPGTPRRSPEARAPRARPGGCARRWERARERALRRYAVRRLVDDVDALYRELLATTSPTTRR